jgi:hypothetical protein
MKRTDREQARRVLNYVDELVLHRRAYSPGADPLSPQDQEFVRLRDLVECLSDVEVAAPAGFQEALALRIRESAALEPPARPRHPAVRAAMLAAAVLAGILVLSRSVIDVPVVSAQAVLSRSDAALTGLVRPGQLLYRRWKVTSTLTGGTAAGTSQNDRIIEEWMDGADFDRVAGRWYSKKGELQIAYATRLHDGEYRPYVYFSPGMYGERLGVMNIEPTRREFESALTAFPESVRRALRVYLDRNYIYAPITGERNFNRAMFDAPEPDVPEMPRILVSFDHSLLNATPVYRVRLRDSASVTFNWRSSGPPLIRLARAEIVRYIARESFLSVRTEERYVFEDGRRRFTTRELSTTERLEIEELSSDPFAIDVPAGTPIQRQSALEQLAGVADILKRVPAFTSRLSRESGTPVHQPH